MDSRIHRVRWHVTEAAEDENQACDAHSTHLPVTAAELVPEVLHGLKASRWSLCPLQWTVDATGLAAWGLSGRVDMPAPDGRARILGGKKHRSRRKQECLAPQPRAWQQRRRRGGRGCRDYAPALLSRKLFLHVLTDTLAQPTLTWISPTPRP